MVTRAGAVPAEGGFPPEFRPIFLSLRPDSRGELRCDQAMPSGIDVRLGTAAMPALRPASPGLRTAAAGLAFTPTGRCAASFTDLRRNLRRSLVRRQALKPAEAHGVGCEPQPIHSTRLVRHRRTPVGDSSRAKGWCGGAADRAGNGAGQRRDAETGRRPETHARRGSRRRSKARSHDPPTGSPHSTRRPVPGPFPVPARFRFRTFPRS